MMDAWPLALVTVAANRAVARLQDSSLPAGAALGLLITLVRMFGDISLNDQVLVANIEKEEQLLEVSAGRAATALATCDVRQSLSLL